MDEEIKIFNIKEYRKAKADDTKLDAETLKVWNFAGEIETAIINGLKTIPSIQITGVLANRLGEMLRYTRVEIGVDATEQIVEMVKKYSK
jgi:hypothetical protein